MPSETFSVDSPIQAKVRLPIGQLTISAVQGGQATASVEPSQPGDEAARALSEECRISFADGELVVGLPERFAWRRGPASLDVTLALPSGSSVAVSAGILTLTTEGPLHDVSIKTGTGTLTVAEADGAVTIRCGDGTIEIGRATSLALKSGRGDLRIGQVSDLQVKTAQGSVDVGASRGTVHVKGAMVSLDVREASGGDITFEAAMGSARVGVLEGTTVALDLSSATGDARCELPMSDGEHSGEAALRVRLKTASGDVVVSRALVPASAES